MRQSEFKKRYDPELGRFSRQHIYGEGVFDTLLKKAVNKTITTAGEHVGKKAGDKIISMLQSKNKKTKKVNFSETAKQNKNAGENITSILQQDRYQQLGRILNDD